MRRLRPAIVVALLGLAALEPSRAAAQAPAWEQEPFAPWIERLPMVEEEPLEVLPPLEPVPAGEPVEDDCPLPREFKLVEVKPEPPPSPWDGSFELGLKGSTGNSQTFNTRAGLKLSRKTEVNELDLDLTYARGRADSIENENEFLGEGRSEWLFEKSPLTVWIEGSFLYDRFTAFDYRVQSDAGMGYTFLEDEATKLIGRVGAGMSREIGGPDNSTVPESSYGLEFEHELTERQKIKASSKLFHDIGDYNDFRLNSKASWEVLVDPELNLSLTLSVADRYDSTPNGAKRNDLDYAALFLWKF